MDSGRDARPERIALAAPPVETPMASADADPRIALDDCLAQLADNKPAQDVLQRLRAIEPSLGGDPLLRARLLRARAIASNRLGFPEEALGDLHQARRLLEGSDNRQEHADIFHAIATVYSWRGEGREAALALMQMIAEALADDDKVTAALALIEGGRLQMEIGRPAEAESLLTAALDIAPALPRREFQRAWVNLAQARVAADRRQRARELLEGMPEVLAQAPPRLTLLAHLERARLALRSGALDAVAPAIEAAHALAPADREAFERVEVAQVEAELALARGDADAAARQFEGIVARYAADDLAGREVQARMMHAHALDALGRTDDAAQTLAAALRRAIARGLSGHADTVRSRLMERTQVSETPSPILTAAMESDTDRRFVRQRPLGAGAFGKVMRAYDLELGIEVAIKRTTLQGVYDPAVRERMRHAALTEMAAASRLAHPGIARVFGVLPLAGGDTMVIEELIEGPTLRQAMEGGLPAARIFELLSRIAFSLAAVHSAGVVHRDLKPDNIILRGGDAPVLIDFGIALLKSDSGERGIGTPAYMAPEQASGRRTDARADLYALGVIAYEMLTGTRPERRNQRYVRDELTRTGADPDIVRLIRRLLMHRLWRPRSASEVGTIFSQGSARPA